MNFKNSIDKQHVDDEKPKASLFYFKSKITPCLQAIETVIQFNIHVYIYIIYVYFL